MPIDLRDFVIQAEAIVADHAIGPEGAYRRWNVQDAAGSRDLGCNPYGCADAANILYMIGRFPRDPAARAGWVATLRGMQDAATGLFDEATHHTIHTTAHCVAALELFDARPSHPLTALHPLTDIAGMRDFMAALDWATDPWRSSHRGAGLFAALAITETVGLDWLDAYFDWLWEHTDPATGLFGGGAVVAPVTHSGATTLVPHMAGTFHYLFNMQWAKRPLRHPDRLIDSCLAMLEEHVFPLGARVGFAEIDWLYCVNRASRETDHRFAEARAAVERLGRRLAEFLLGLDRSDDGLNDLHALFGTLCALTELQQAVPGLVRTDRPLKLVLDRRPFI